ncbi:MAG: hypothetical protein A2742_01845 [Candidatus Yanofskybacteria bacterium RIFCSPHIGHO2_01_FULL_43_32]|nr:MAG: hypothetical protein A2742_01845 [Candidatus Yanofskybacteria bacterium RIFCSPHIGHO2_01_FULL_43_32]OGN11856.1 MAG: hypothetical protein A3C69_01550 [Candidatus Yanofskybacteria bacterium RIFCSPHIGHO2_02_FULL_43_12]OGN18068.1 MAG: hypothetical protein A3E34_02230 [Candidatus Yanofskybacteria bacterium RIFCSPHIGHO2_12_FULL_43_11]OGN25346.1 MAG: hypothetical protein A2923_01635 [Candidatus Yanofskybacteria bacterium RIFCSPLOWO2_01_FULL_43_46]
MRLGTEGKGAWLCLFAGLDAPIRSPVFRERDVSDFAVLVKQPHGITSILSARFALFRNTDDSSRHIKPHAPA